MASRWNSGTVTNAHFITAVFAASICRALASLQERLSDSSPALGTAVVHEMLGVDSSDEDAVEELAARMQQILKGA